MRRRFLAFISPILFVTFGSTAFAGEGVYIGGFAGLTFVSESDIDDGSGTSLSLEYDPGFNVGGVVGYGFPQSFRVEGEISYRNVGADTLNDAGTSISVDGDASALSFMANAFYDVDIGNTFTPYLGGGLGLAIVSINDLAAFGATITDDDDTVFAYQLGAGISWEINANLAVTFDYRWFETTDPSMKTVAGDPFEVEVSSHNVGVGIRYHF